RRGVRAPSCVGRAASMLGKLRHMIAPESQALPRSPSHRGELGPQSLARKIAQALAKGPRTQTRGDFCAGDSLNLSAEHPKDPEAVQDVPHSRRFRWTVGGLVRARGALVQVRGGWVRVRGGLV